ncbi:division/cell wall cluster transcriptional repressor MraZ [Candidatus Beckwithbacteria bacterium]|nr:division/cell wall cluster transcriptional repressor MraZ [Candidatus Beckwithbacteria bacterium]
MYLGNYQTRFDQQKGRTAIPSSFRKQLGKKAIITKGYENSLMIIPVNDWEKVIGKVLDENFLSGFSRQTERFLLGNAFEISFDSQGRFIIPVNLREYAKLENETIFVGVGNRVEMWDKKVWEKNNQYLDENIAQLSEKLDEKQRTK